MVINGQPKSTSEYIQASSRVGRDIVPGLVVIHYAGTKPRDRSHYEAFTSYHQALYRYVEPASVTPFSPPARNRALHAVLAMLVRHASGLTANTQAKMFDRNDPLIKNLLELLLDRARRVDPLEYPATERHLERLVDEWNTRAENARLSGGQLLYGTPDRQYDVILKDFGDRRSEGWETLHSMRNVDRDCGLLVRGETDAS